MNYKTLKVISAETEKWLCYPCIPEVGPQGNIFYRQGCLFIKFLQDFLLEPEHPKKSNLVKVSLFNSGMSCDNYKHNLGCLSYTVPILYDKSYIIEISH